MSDENAFELERRQRIQSNQARLQELGLQGALGGGAGGGDAGAGAKPKRRRDAEAEPPPEPTRRSRRTAAQPVQQPLRELNGEPAELQALPPHRAPRRRAGPMTAPTADDHAQHNAMRMSYMSDAALVRRAWKITRMDKLESFVALLESDGDGGRPEVLAEARAALAALQRGER